MPRGRPQAPRKQRHTAKRVFDRLRAEYGFRGRYDALERLRNALAHHAVRYLLIGKTGALFHGYPDTTQDVDLFVDPPPANRRVLVSALCELQFPLADKESHAVESAGALVQLNNGPFDLNLVFAPDGIEHFEGAFARAVRLSDFPVCSMEDTIASKRAANRVRDREVLPRLEAFVRYQREHARHGEP